MKIQELRLVNYRKFADSRFYFNTKTNVTVLIGDNATGKSAILNALSIMMGSYLLDFKVVRGARHIRKNEVRIAQIKVGELVTLEPQWSEGVKLSCIGSLAELSGQDPDLKNPIEWSRELTSEEGKTTRINAKKIAFAGKNARSKMEKGEDVTLPVLTYYGTGRLWHKKQDVALTKPDSRSHGYRDCLDPASNHRLFFKWFSRLEQASLQKRTEYGVLEAVRNAVKECIPACKHFYFDLEQAQLMLEFENGELFSFENLSDGYRNMLAIVADIAHRAARLNPQLGKRAALDALGIVLIDEIDLHLHPKWQREVVNSLRRAFPKIQFIVSTHSPFVIQSLKLGEVIDLNSDVKQDIENKELSLHIDSSLAEPAPKHNFSDCSIEDIVEGVMGICLPSRSARLQRMYVVAEKYYKLLDNAEHAVPEEIERLKVQLDELSAPFSENVAYHAFLERQRIKKGVVSREEEQEDME